MMPYSISIEEGDDAMIYNDHSHSPDGGSPTNYYTGGGAFSGSSYAEDKGARYRRPGSAVGYTGHFQIEPPREHVLDSPNKKIMIRGYTGHRPNLKNLCGKPKIPSEDTQMARIVPAKREEFKLTTKQLEKQKKRSFQLGDQSTYRTFAIHMDTLERYAAAVTQVIERGQSQEMLLKIVQAKLSERVRSYAEQIIKTRKLFESVDINKDGVLDENEFRSCLEALNVQFDDVQSLALFAYFDGNDDGFVEWQEFADHAMVPNPKEGTAVLPKIITTLNRNDDYELANKTGFASKKHLEKFY